MHVYGIVGRKNSGKTHLVTRLVSAAARRGLVVSTVKHAHHALDVDQPGKDSWLHREAGAHEVIVASASRWALLHELRGAPEPTLDELLARLGPSDLVLVEGFKRGNHPKLEVYRADCGQPVDAVITRIDSAAHAVAACVPDSARKLRGRSGMA